MQQSVFISRSGCLLPALIFLNLLFGWTFIKSLPWLLLELSLIFIFIVRGYFFAKKIISQSQPKRGAIDIEGEVVDGNSGKENRTLPKN